MLIIYDEYFLKVYFDKKHDNLSISDFDFEIFVLNKNIIFIIFHTR